MRGPISGDISAAIRGIADAVNPKTLKLDYPEAAGAIIALNSKNGKTIRQWKMNY